MVVSNHGSATSAAALARIEVEGCVGFWGDTRWVGRIAGGAVDTLFAGPFAVDPAQCVASVFVDTEDDIAESDESNDTPRDQPVCVLVRAVGPGAASRIPFVFPVPNRDFLTIGLSTPAVVQIFDGAERLVRKLEATGSAPIIWDGRSTAGARVADGIYFVRVPVSGSIGRVVMVR